MEKEQLTMTQEWDKTFPKSDEVKHRKVTFLNRFGITLAADMYIPKEAARLLPAIAVSGPYGAVKEQASGLYAQHLAEQGYQTIAFDPLFRGESGGKPRYSSSMDINTEGFCAAIDFLSCHEQVDVNRIGILGICGWGGIAFNAAALDPRIQATACVTLYNMTQVTQQGYFDSMDEEARHRLKQELAKKRTAEFRTGEINTQGDLPEQAPDDAPDFLKQYVAYYKSPMRGYHPRSLNFNQGWNITFILMLLNHDLWVAASEIRTSVLIVHGEKAHSRYFGEEAFKSAFSLAKNVWAEDEKGEDAKAAFLRKMIFLIGEPNTAYALYFVGNSYLACISDSLIPLFNVTFEPRCRNNWHIHKASKGGGQMLVGVAGQGWYQEEGKPAQKFLPGTVIHIPASVKHWQGAAAENWFAPFGLRNSRRGYFQRMAGESVSDEVYNQLKI